MTKRQSKTVVRDTDSSSPAQHDSADILAEVDAVRDDDTGDLLVDETKILEGGAVDAESIRENRRLKDVVGKKRANIKGVPFNTSDVLVMYETLIKFWPPNTIDISVRRLTGAPVQHVIVSRPRSGAELYAELLKVHGQSGEAEYEVKCLDSNGKQYRGTGRITLPDSRSPQQQGQPMPNNNYPPHGAPYAYPPQAPAPGYPQHPAPAAQPAPAAPAPAPSAPFDGNSLLAAQQFVFDMIRQYQPQAQPAPQQAAPAPVAAPPNLQSLDVQSLLALQRQVFEMLQAVQPQAAVMPPSASAPMPSPQAPPNMAMMGVPPVQPPPGTIWVPGFGFVALEKLMQAVTGVGAVPERPRFRQDDSDQGSRERHFGRPMGYPRQQHQEPERNASAQFRDALSVLRSAVDVVQEVNTLLPNHPMVAQAQAEPDDDAGAAASDDSPVQIIDTGHAKLVVDRKGGSIRGWETMWANMDKVLKWAGEQHDKVQSAQQRAQQTQTQHALPPGYVEVGPGYQPPPGYVAVPVREPLPPPPPEMPRPVGDRPRKPWNIPISNEE